MSAKRADPVVIIKVSTLLQFAIVLGVIVIGIVYLIAPWRDFTMLVALVLGVIAIGIVYFIAPTWQDHVKFVTLVLAVAAAIYSAYFVGAALRMQVESGRQLAAFALLKQVEAPDFVRLKNVLEKHIKDHENLSDAELYAMISNNEELDDAVTIVLNVYEKVSIGIQHNIVDEDILHMALASMIPRNWNQLRGYVDQLRKEYTDENYFREIEKIVDAWAKGKRLSDGKPLPPLGPGAL